MWGFGGYLCVYACTTTRLFALVLCLRPANPCAYAVATRSLPADGREGADCPHPLRH